VRGQVAESSVLKQESTESEPNEIHLVTTELKGGSGRNVFNQNTVPNMKIMNNDYQDQDQDPKGVHRIVRSEAEEERLRNMGLSSPGAQRVSGAGKPRRPTCRESESLVSDYNIKSGQTSTKSYKTAFFVSHGNERHDPDF